MAGKKKQTRRRQSPEARAAVLERAKVVGVTQAAREFGIAGTQVARYAKTAGVALPQFRFLKGQGLFRVGESGQLVPASGNPVPRPVEMTPPDRPRSPKDQVSDTPRNREIAFAARQARADGVSLSTVGKRFGISGSRVSQVWGRMRDKGLFAPGDATTLLSRPEPSPEEPSNDAPVASLVLDKPRRGRPPSARSEQLPLYTNGQSNGHSEPQRVQGVPVDDAESARQQAIDEMRDSVTRQALKERDALKTVFEMFFREKLDR